MKIAIYIRVSTHYQIDKDSLPLQRNELINYCKYILGTENYEVFEDAGYSGKDTDRPGFQEMMSRVENGEFTHVLVWKIDRISRNLIDFAKMHDEMKKYKVTFISKNEQFDTSTAMGEAMLKIILIFAELERKLAAERVYATMLSRAEKGLWNGANVPLGYKWSEEDSFPIVDNDESNTVIFIYEQYLELRSSTKVMISLNKNNIKTKRGGKWTTKTVSDIIRNPFYKGTYRYNYRESARGAIKDESEWIVLPNNHEAIIDDELWDKCNYIMDENAKKNTALYRSNTNVHLFSGLLTCARCNNGFRSNLDVARKNGFQPSTYRCQSKVHKSPCSSTKMASDVRLAPFVFQYISSLAKAQDKISNMTTVKILEKSILNSSDVFKDVKAIVGLDSLLYGSIDVEYESTEIEAKENKTSTALEIYEKDKEKHQRALQRLDNLFLYSEDAMSEKDYLLQKRNITIQIDEIDAKIKDLYKKDTTPVANDLFLESAYYFILNNEFMKKKKVDYRKLAINTDRQVVKDFLNLVVSRVIVDNGRVSAIRFKNGVIHEFIYKPCLH